MDIFENYDYEKEYFCSPLTVSKHFTRSMYLLINIKEFGLGKFSNYLEANLHELNLQNEKGWTLLAIAVRNSKTMFSEEIVSYLLRLGPDVNISTYHGLTPLNIICTHILTDSSLETLVLLLNVKPDLNKPDNNGWTPLMSLVDFNENNHSVNALKLLIKAGADVNIIGEDGWSALMLVCRYSRKYGRDAQDIIRLLLESGADINIRNNNGWTALSMACRYSNSESDIDTVKALLDHNPDMSIRTIDGYTALSLADTVEVKRLLITHGADVYEIPLFNLDKELIEIYYHRKYSKIAFDYVVRLLTFQAHEFILRPTSVYQRLRFIKIQLDKTGEDFKVFKDKKFLNEELSYGEFLAGISINKDNYDVKIKDLLSFPSIDKGFYW